MKANSFYPVSQIGDGVFLSEDCFHLVIVSVSIPMIIPICTFHLSTFIEFLLLFMDIGTRIHIECSPLLCILCLGGKFSLCCICICTVVTFYSFPFSYIASLCISYHGSGSAPVIMD